MPLRLTYASHATALVDHLVDSLASPNSPPGSVVPVLMPSLPLVERVKIAFARRHGVAMGTAFLLPNAFTEHIAHLVGLDPLHMSWRVEGLAWRLLPLLAEMTDEGWNLRLRSACVDARARLLLAGELADRFDQYLYFRPSMIAAWDRNEPWEDLPGEVREDEAWQRELWRRLSQTLADHPHPALRLQNLTARIQRGDGFLPDSLEVLATGPLPPALLPLIRVLANRTQVCLRALMPSTEYLGDIRSGRTQMREELEVDPAWEANPLLSHLGRQAIASFRSFEECLIVDGQEYDPISSPENNSGTLLACLQADIRAARQPDPKRYSGNTETPVAVDRSIRMHRCHGPTREIEVLRDELLDAFDNLPGLRASEILILVPDLDTYGPLAEAILKEREPSLPLRLSERRLDQSDPLVCGLQMLLGLAAGRAHLSDGLALIESPAVAAHVESLGIQPEEFVVRLRASGITWGLNAAHRQKLGAGHIAAGTWREGLNRLLSGLWLGDAPTASDVTQHPVLPVSGDLVGNPVVVGALLDWLDGLLRLLEVWQTDASPAQWANRCAEALDEVLGAGADRCDSTVVVDLVDQLRAGETKHACSLPMEAAAVQDWLGRVVQDEIRVVSRVGGCIAMGGFKPMRAIPCRVLAVLGLHDSSFPRRTRAAAWDLLAAAPRPGDRNALQEDRQLFLDAILAARDRVILTATARNIRTNKEEPLSACVDEFLWAAGKTAAQTTIGAGAIRDELIADHPLQPFNPANFVGEGASFDRGSCEIARALLEPSSDTARFHADVPRRPTSLEPLDLDLHGLIRTLKNPWTAWLDSLNVTLPREGEDPVSLDREPVEAPTGLNRWQIQAQVLDAVMENERKFLEERLAADRLIPYGELGSAMARDSVQQALAMAHFAEKEAGGPLHPHRLVYREAHQQIAGTIKLNGDGNLNVVIVPADLKVGPQHRLSAWVHATFAAACGLKADTLIVSRKGTSIKTDRMLPITQSLAKSKLHELLELFKEAQLHPLPFSPKTSAAIFAATEVGGDEAAAANRVWEEAFLGPPGDGQSASARLSWRGQDPFAEGTLGEWCRLAELVFRPMKDWFANTVDIVGDESPDG